MYVVHGEAPTVNRTDGSGTLLGRQAMRVKHPSVAKASCCATASVTEKIVCKYDHMFMSSAMNIDVTFERARSLGPLEFRGNRGELGQKCFETEAPITRTHSNMVAERW